ncbi:MAG: hypothetical protein H5T33_05945 [Candidatus Methanosuratus sp.]|nr:hypothetical protein [Candidatus Methanosuratincola sp.]
MAKCINDYTDYIMRMLSDKGLYYFTVSDLAKLLDVPVRKAYAAVARLEGRGLVKRIEKGKYVVLGYEPARVLANPFFVATHVVRPSYVSFWSALSYYGFTEQAPRKVFLASIHRKGEIGFADFAFKYVSVRPWRFFGYVRERSGELDFLIADREKALIDSLASPQYAGGMREVTKAVSNAQSAVSAQELQRYALLMKSAALCSRLGYLLERDGINADTLMRHASREYIKLDPSGRRSGRWDGRWRVIVNMTEADLTGWRET